MKLLNDLMENLQKNESRHTTETIKRAFLFLLPVFIIGATALTLQYFPVAPVREFINSVWDGFFYRFFDVIYRATYGFASVYLVLALAYSFSQSLDFHKDVKNFYVFTVLICYFASLGRVLFSDSLDIFSYTNMSNIFPALLTSLIAGKAFVLFYKLFNRNKLDHLSSFTRSLHSILPCACCVVLFALSAELIGLIDGINNMNDLTIKVFSSLFESLGATYLGGALIMFAESVFWFFGIHGGNVFDAMLTNPEGAFALASGQIVSKPFIDTFVLMGGCGTTTCLFIALLLFTKDKKKKKLCRLAGPTLLFNVNELLVFGVPLVLNPIYLVPFIFCPFLCYTTAYLATYLGLVPLITNANVQWTTPILISGYQATGSIAGSLLQLFQLFLGVAVYIPFVILDNKKAKQNEYRYLNELTEICHSCEARKIPYSIDTQRFTLRAFEDDVAAALLDDVENGNVYLRYQPQVKEGKILSAEALLRFRYNDCGYVYPPLIIAIACKNNLFYALSQEIVKRAIADLKKVQQTTPDFKIAVNLKLDLLMQEEFRNWLIESISAASLAPHTFGVEITEDAKLSDSEDYANAFHQLKQACIEVYMDDFSMGHTSISLLQKNYFDYIKIDGNLIKQIENERIQSIVSSIVQLGKELRFNVIAEYVEREKQRDILLDIGCYILQGYLYYKDLDIRELNEELEKQKQS